MENLRQEVVFQSFRPVQDVSLNTSASLESEQEQPSQLESDTQHEGHQETLNLLSLSQIELRMKKLHNRLLILLKSQEYKQKADQNRNRTPDEVTTKDSGEPCELEVIQKELLEMQELKRNLETTEESSLPLANGGHRESHSYFKEGPRSGIYTLPPIQSDVRAAAPRPTGPIIPVESLSRTPDITECPSCKEVVLTETRSTIGEAIWIVCVLCSLLGCVAGCCLVPFGVKQLRNVSHRCPQCQAPIYTFRPF